MLVGKVGQEAFIPHKSKQKENVYLSKNIDGTFIDFKKSILKNNGSLLEVNI